MRGGGGEVIRGGRGDMASLGGSGSVVDVTWPELKMMEFESRNVDGWSVHPLAPEISYANTLLALAEAPNTPWQLVHIVGHTLLYCLTHLLMKRFFSLGLKYEGLCSGREIAVPLGAPQSHI